MTTVYITEKPSQAKEVAEALGISHKTDGVYRRGNIVVCHAVGHIIEQAEPQAYGEQYATWRLDTLPCLPNPWQLQIKASAKSVFTTLKQWIKQADHIVIATDADREGEVIAREVLDYVKYKGSIERLWVQETTPSGYKKGFDKLQPGHEFANLYQSGLGRARADWVSGMNLTRALTCAFSPGGKGNTLHFGRVQTPTLALIVRREHAIAQFKPSDYYLIHAYAYFDTATVKMALKLQDRWKDKEGRISDIATAKSIVSEFSGYLSTDSTTPNIRTSQFVVSHYETKEEKTPPPLPYYLGSLQKECASKFDLRPDEVLEICQKLYEECKLISYPRTEGEHIPEQIFSESSVRLDALAKMDSSIAEFCKMADLSKQPRSFNDEKVAKSGSHFALIPTDTAHYNLSHLTPKEMQVYDLIRRRYIAQFLGNYVYDKTVIEISVDSDMTFVASGNTPKVAGWKRIYQQDQTDTEEASTLPILKLGQSVSFAAPYISAEATQTKPPPRYNKSSILTAMESIDKEIDDPRLAAVMKGKEKAGIGTNATRGEVIKKLYDGGYIIDQKKSIVPTKKGFGLIELLNKVCPELSDLALTAMWEDELAKVESGVLTLEKFDHAIGRFVGFCIDKIKASAGSHSIGDKHVEPCPQCSKPMIRRKGEKGYWWGCSGYPTCKYTAIDQKGKPVAKNKTHKK